jgi:protein O-GlcNAc transferase
LEELIADNREDLLRIVLALARDTRRLAHLRDGMRARMGNSPLTDSVGYTMALEDILRGAWRDWCEHR